MRSVVTYANYKDAKNKKRYLWSGNINKLCKNDTKPIKMCPISPKVQL